VDWDFVALREGGQRLEGYIPAAGRSGVTIATGVDLGQRSAADIEKLALGEDLKAKLRPYAGKRRRSARRFLKRHPLRLTLAEAAALDRAVRRTLLESLTSSYRDDVSGEAKLRAFESLPAEAQTVIASLAHQYGPHLHRATPRFWKWVTSQDWEKAVAELEDFGDRYATRRLTEAELLKRILVQTEGDPPPDEHLSDATDGKRVPSVCGRNSAAVNWFM
jgi:hypothetical protein